MTINRNVTVLMDDRRGGCGVVCLMYNADGDDGYDTEEEEEHEKHEELLGSQSCRQDSQFVVGLLHGELELLHPHFRLMQIIGLVIQCPLMILCGALGWYDYHRVRTLDRWPSFLLGI